MAEENPSNPAPGDEAKPKIGRPKGSKNGVSAMKRDGLEKIPRNRRKSPWFGRKLKMLRKARSLSQPAMEKALLDGFGIRMPHLALGRIERGDVTATTDEAWAICEFFEVPMRWMCDPKNTITLPENFVVAAKDYFRAMHLIDQIGPVEAVNRLLKIEGMGSLPTAVNANRITPPESDSKGRGRGVG